MLKEDVNLKKVVVYIIIAVIIMNLFSLSSFAVNEVDSANEETDGSIEELNYSITLDTSKENRKIQSTASSTSHSLYAPLGGTLVLDYIGETNPLGQVVFTKVVYLNNEYTLLLQSAFSSNKTEEIIEFLVDQGVSAVTETFTYWVTSIYLDVVGSFSA